MEDDNCHKLLAKLKQKLHDQEKSGTNGNVPHSSVHVDEWRPLFYLGHTGDNEDTKKKTFQRVRASLVNKRIIEVTNDYYSIRDSGTSTGHL